MITRANLPKLKDPKFLASYVHSGLLQLRHTLDQSEFQHLCKVIRPYTLLNTTRLYHLYQAVNHIIAYQVPGDVVECGSARGGSAALMGMTLRARGSQRRLWLLDTFAGLPEPNQNDPDYEIARRFTGGCLGTQSDVTRLLAECDVLAQSQLVPGLFQNTLPQVDITQIAMLHIDCDWHDSVRTCLDYLYDRVTPGGIIQIDDYGFWAGTRKAVDGFLAERGLDLILHEVDYEARQLIKAA